MAQISITQSKGGNLMAAHNQWATRPMDERFATVADLLAHEEGRAARSSVVHANQGTLRVVPGADNALLLQGSSGRRVAPTSWAFGQLATRIGAPASYLQTLPAQLAADAMNHGLTTAGVSRDASLLLEHDGADAPTLRAFTSQRYMRVWNHELAAACVELQAANPHWTEPTAFQRAGGSKVANAWGESVKLPAAFAGERDCFIFLCDYERGVKVPGQDHPLARGFFLENSEVGACSLKVTLFMFDFVCSNMIVWGAKEVTEISVRHLGAIRDRVLGQESDVWHALNGWNDMKASAQEAQVLNARTVRLGDDKDEVIATVGKRIKALPQRTVGAAFDLAEATERYGDPRTIWGLVQGLTETSQTAEYAGDRVAVDRAAGEILGWAL